MVVKDGHLVDLVFANVAFRGLEWRDTERKKRVRGSSRTKVYQGAKTGRGNERSWAATETTSGVGPGGRNDWEGKRETLKVTDRQGVYSTHTHTHTQEVLGLLFFLLMREQMWECLGGRGGSFEWRSISLAGLGIWKGRKHTNSWVNEKARENWEESGNQGIQEEMGPGLDIIG